MENFVNGLEEGEEEEGRVEVVPFEEYILADKDLEPLEEEPRKPQPSKKVKRFQCNTCNLLCSSPSTLQVHIRTHTGERPYECSYCDYRGAAPFAVRAHMRTHTGERPFACNFCNFRSAHSTDLTIHMRRHTGEKPFACQECPYRSASKSAIQAHMTTHSKVKHIKCLQCDYRCSSKQLLTFHQRRHMTIKPFKCDFCKYSAVTKSLIKVHMRIHTGEKPFKCSECDYACRAKSGLRSHMRKHEDNSLQCRHCSYVAPSNYAILLHEKSHSAKPGKSPAARPRRKKPANKPTRTTILEKNLACFMCDESFFTTLEWLTHLMTHGSGALKFRCDSCDFTTAWQQNLTNHCRLKHDKVTEEVHLCPVCYQSFTRKDNLRRHVVKSHDTKGILQSEETSDSGAFIDEEVTMVPELGQITIVSGPVLSADQLDDGSDSSQHHGGNFSEDISAD
ncbi:Hypothetical protein NTJ_11401 [Nesidiocoris tenuis]|uniref:C2H2-type domain-containing protein n=1 Tax=Nesidiocoris tenuis TaxID=355587 RepID=A0ABN7B2G2_9HEMI|nr:Hypothetical protein NTJ_11401 [Nesidiocoris tenuis]